MGNSNERPGKSKEFPPTPGEGSWWEYKQGDSEPRCVIGIIDRDGKKIARILPKQVMRQYAATPDVALAQAESMPLEEFERMLKSVPKPKKGVPTPVVNAFIAALKKVEGERIPDAAPSAPNEPEKLKIFERPNYGAGDLCTVDGLELSSQFYADNSDLFYEKDGMPALPRPVIRLYAKRVGITGEESPARTQRIMEGTIGKGELFRLISPEEIRQLYRDEKQGRKGDTKPVVKDESVPAEKPKDIDAPIGLEASRILGQANGRLANIERTFADAESGRDGTPIFEAKGIEELRGVLVEAQEMMRQMVGITDPAKLDSALTDLIKKTDLFDVVYTRLLRQGIKPANRADRSQDARAIPERGQEAARAEQLISEAKDLNQLVQAVEEIKMFPGGSKTWSAEEMVSAIIAAARLDPVDPSKHPIVARGITRTYGLRDAVIRLLNERKARKEMPQKQERSDEPKSFELQPQPAPEPTLDTPREQKQALERKVTSLMDLVESRKSPEVQQKKQAYFEALRKYQEERGRLGLMAEGLVGEFASAEVKKLRADWIAARAAVAREQLSAATERLKDREGSDSKKVLDRYSRLVTFRSVVMGAEEEERQVRLGSLAERERKLDAMEAKEKPRFERVRAWYKRQPPSARILGTSALITGGVALTFGASPLFLALGVGSAGLRWVGEAQKSKNRVVSKAAYGISRLTSVMGIAGAAGEAAIAGLHKISGTRNAAAETLGRRDVGNLGDTKGLEKVSRIRSRAANVEEKIMRDRRRGRLLGSLFGGAALGGLAADNAAETSGSSAPDAAPEPIAQNAEAPQQAPDQSEAPQAEQPASDASTADSAAETVPQTPTSPEGLVAGATINTPGEGTNQLFLDLRQSIGANELLSQNPSPAVQHILETNVNELSRDLGTEAWNSSLNDNGLLTRMGDQLIIDENQNVWIQQGDNPPQLYLENTDAEPGGFRIHQIEPATSIDSPVAVNAVEPAAPAQGTPAVEAVPEESLAETVPVIDSSPISAVPEESEPLVTGTPSPVEVPPPSTQSTGPIGTPLEDRLDGATRPPGTEEAVPAPTTSDAPIGTPLEDRLETSGGFAPAAETQWQTGNALPAERGFFKYAELLDGKEVFYANGMRPNEFIEFANRNGIDLRNTVVRFDDPEERLFGGITHRITEVRFDPAGNLVAPPERVVDASGVVQEYLDTRVLKERIA